jgi:hypothetical protein
MDRFEGLENAIELNLQNRELASKPNIPLSLLVVRTTRRTHPKILEDAELLLR